MQRCWSSSNWMVATTASIPSCRTATMAMPKPASSCGWKRDELHKLNDLVALHPQMRSAKSLFDDGRLAIVQGVGYPNPDRSHFRSMRIWQTASMEDDAHNAYGWLGQALDGNLAGNKSGEASAIYVGEDQTPVALWGRRSAATAISRIEDLTLQLKPMD